jgi:hypothetical protein
MEGRPGDEDGGHTEDELEREEKEPEKEPEKKEPLRKKMKKLKKGDQATKSELKIFLKEAGMQTGGNREELQKRLDDYRAGNADAKKIKKVKKAKKPKPTIDAPTNDVSNIKMKKANLSKKKKKKEPTFISDSDDDNEVEEEKEKLEEEEEKEEQQDQLEDISPLRPRYERDTQWPF